MTNYIYLTQEEIRALLHIRGKLKELEELTNIIHAEDLLEERVLCRYSRKEYKSNKRVHKPSAERG